MVQHPFTFLSGRNTQGLLPANPLWAGLLVLLLLVFLRGVPLNGANDQIPLLLEKAEFFLSKGNIMSAREYLRRAKSLDRKDQAVMGFEQRLLKFVDEQVAMNLKEAEHLLAANEVPKALEHFHRVLRFAPEHPEATRKIAEITKLKTQITHYRNHGVTISGGSSQVYNLNLYSASSSMLRAKTAFAQGDLATALGLVDSVLAREPTYEEAKELRQKILQKQKFQDLLSGATGKTQNGNFAEAEEYYTQCLAIKPNDLENLILRGRARLRLERYTEALDDFFLAYEKGVGLDRLRSDILSALVGRRDFQKAYGFSAWKGNLSAAEPFSFRLWCYWKAYPAACGFFVLVFLAGFFVLAWIADNLASMSEKTGISNLWQLGFLVGKCMIGHPENHVDGILQVSRYFKHPWVSYLTGILLLAADRKPEAQEPLQAALSSPSLAPRAFFFLGLVRSELKEALSLHDFEQAFHLGLKWHPLPWIPGFLGKLERKLLTHRFPQEESEPMVGLARRTMNCLIHT
jgi:tetratricopeptide (TPR) repeat protein